MRHRHPQRATARSQGFVLVGVVMMVLALTILGLSLFSLSSYEAQFMNHSLDSDQALQCALGGLDRARFVLGTSPDTLGMVKLGLPRDSVIWARASQVRSGITPDSSGIMVENGRDVLIEVAARYRGVTRYASSSFQYSQGTNYYERLMSVGAGGIVQYTNIGTGSCGTVQLGDSLWVYGPIVATDELNPPTTWPNCLFALPNFGVNPRYVPTPQVATFLGSHAGTPIHGDVLTYTLSGPPGTVSYYKTDEPFLPSDDDKFSSHAQGDATVTVDGWAVWMLPHGLRVDGYLRVKAGTDPNACLVIVARQGSIKQSNVTYRAGIWCFGGLRSEIPIFLVTDDAVEIEQRGHPLDFSLAMQLSIYANSVVLSGPELGHGLFLTLSYDSHTMTPLIAELMDVGALPNSVNASPLSFQPGTWRSSR